MARERQLASDGFYLFKDLIWMAGFFDGEGHIDIARYKTSPHGYLVVSVSQDKSHSDILNLFTVWGGRVFPANKIGLWRWQAYASEASSFLKDVLPYLKVRKEAAKLAIEFQGTMHKRGGKEALNQEVEERREALIRQFRHVQPARRDKAFLKLR